MPEPWLWEGRIVRHDGRVVVVAPVQGGDDNVRWHHREQLRIAKAAGMGVPSVWGQISASQRPSDAGDGDVGKAER